MKIQNGTKIIKKRHLKSIMDIEFDSGYQLHVFQGFKGPNDILIKYTESGKRMRTPKHIHWAVDILIKMQGNKNLTRKFLGEIQKCWVDAKPLVDNDIYNLKKLIIYYKDKIDLDYFKELSNYGEYDIEFLFTLMQLLIAMEKTDREDAHMFGDIIDKLLEDEIDIFAIMSTAGFNGRFGR